MNLLLKENYIIHKSPLLPYIVNVTNGENYQITQTEAQILSLLDGTYSIETLIDFLCETALLSNDERQILSENVKSMLNNYSDYITFSNYKRTSTITYGSDTEVLPFEIGVDLTNKCVYECIHCYKSCRRNNSTFIDTKVIMDFLDYVSSKVYSVQLTGGECMLHPDFFEILDYCKKKFPSVVISTTGALINEKNIKHFTDTKVYLSIYSMNENDNDYFTHGIDSLRHTKNAAELLVDNGIHVCLNNIAWLDNKQNIKETFEYATSINANGYGIGAIVPVGRAQNLPSNFIASQEECTELNNFLEKLHSDKYSTYLNTVSLVSDIKNGKPHCGLYQWQITENGTVLACAFFQDKKFSIGNISDIPICYDDAVLNKIHTNLYDFKTDYEKANKSISNICPMLVFLKGGII